VESQTCARYEDGSSKHFISIIIRSVYVLRIYGITSFEFHPKYILVLKRKSPTGKRHIVKDIGSRDYVPLFVDDEFDASGVPNYVEAVGGSFG
jgi:hypothetical protein